MLDLPERRLTPKVDEIGDRLELVESEKVFVIISFFLLFFGGVEG